MIESQISVSKLNKDQLVFSFSKMSKPISDEINNFIMPFYYEITLKNLQVSVIEANKIPEWVSTDWKIYKQTLFHIF